MSRPSKPLHPVVIYDGHCGFCTNQARRLARLARGKLELRSLHEEGLLEKLGLAPEACLTEMKLCTPDGRVVGGAEAVACALRLGGPPLSVLAFSYYLPGVRWLADRAYRWIARNRYRFAGNRTEPMACERHRPRDRR